MSNYKSKEAIAYERREKAANTTKFGAAKEIDCIIPREREKLLKWNGWGYNDSKFTVIDENATVFFLGNR